MVLENAIRKENKFICGKMAKLVQEFSKASPQHGSKWCTR